VTSSPENNLSDVMKLDNCWWETVRPHCI